MWEGKRGWGEGGLESYEIALFTLSSFQCSRDSFNWIRFLETSNSLII